MRHLCGVWGASGDKDGGHLVRDRQRRCLECHRRAARCVARRRVELAGDLLALLARKQQQQQRRRQQRWQQLRVFVREAPHSRAAAEPLRRRQHLLRERNTERGGATLELCVGDRIYLTAPRGLNASWAASSNSFDWGAVSVSDISWSINNVSLANIELDVSGGAGSVVLSGTIANLTAPTLFGETNLLVEPFGWGVVAQGAVSVVPVISYISHPFGSMAGGTQITITGTGFSSAFLEEVIVGGEACTDVEVDDSDGKTIWCVTAPSLVEGWGYVNATFNNVHAVCDVNRTAYNDTASSGCFFKYSYNSTRPWRP